MQNEMIRVRPDGRAVFGKHTDGRELTTGDPPNRVWTVAERNAVSFAEMQELSNPRGAGVFTEQKHLPRTLGAPEEKLRVVPK